MSSIGVVVFRNSPVQVLQEAVNNSDNITNNENVRREIIIVRKKQKIPTVPVSVPVTSLVRAATEPINTSAGKRPRIRDSVEENSKTPTPLAVARRNARERNRVRQVNDGFAALRRHIPEEVASAFETANSNRGPNKKLSKVETLRMAVEYIRNLESLLNISYGDKENSSRPSMESFPSPASSSPRENSQERYFYVSMNSPALEDDDGEEDDLDGSIHQVQPQQYLELPIPETFQLVSTPHLYDEEEASGQPLTPTSDLLGHEEVAPHTIMDGHFPFPSSEEQFSVIPEQSYCNETDVVLNESDFEVKYAESIQQHMHNYNQETELPLEAINPDLMLNHGDYKFKDENIFEDQYTDVELKKELPDIQVTPEDREQFEETLKWWQEKTRQARPLTKFKKN